MRQEPVAFNRKVKGVIQIFRPELPLAAGVCVAIGEVLALGAFPALDKLGLGFACGFLLSGSALISNDYFDLEVDRVNAPQRPLPAGLLAPAEVMALALLAAALGLAAAWLLSPLALPFSVLVWALGFLYNWKLKAAGLWGNLIVCTSVAMTFVLGAIGVGRLGNRLVWTFALMVFVFDLAEEIAGDAMDAEGDRRRGSQSFAITHGRQAALRLSAALFALMIALSVLPLWWGGLGLYYLLPFGLADVLIVFLVIKLMRSRTPSEGRRAMRWLYLSGSLGLLAFLVGSFFA